MEHDIPMITIKMLTRRLVNQLPQEINARVSPTGCTKKRKFDRKPRALRVIKNPTNTPITDKNLIIFFISLFKLIFLIF